MGIDGIGKRGGLPPGIEGGKGVEGARPGADAHGPGRAEAPFRVGGAGAAASAPEVDGARATPLARLRRGELDVEGYVEARVDEATRGLEGLSPAQVADVRALLRERLASDPSLRELVQQATGAAPREPDGSGGEG